MFDNIASKIPKKLSVIKKGPSNLINSFDVDINSISLRL